MIITTFIWPILSFNSFIVTWVFLSFVIMSILSNHLSYFNLIFLPIFSYTSREDPNGNIYIHIIYVYIHTYTYISYIYIKTSKIRHLFLNDLKELYFGFFQTLTKLQVFKDFESLWRPQAFKYLESLKVGKKLNLLRNKCLIHKHIHIHVHAYAYKHINTYAYIHTHTTHTHR